MRICFVQHVSFDSMYLNVIRKIMPSESHRGDLFTVIFARIIFCLWVEWSASHSKGKWCESALFSSCWPAPFSDVSAAPGTGAARPATPLGRWAHQSAPRENSDERFSVIALSGIFFFYKKMRITADVLRLGFQTATPTPSVGRI